MDRLYKQNDAKVIKKEVKAAIFSLLSMTIDRELYNTKGLSNQELAHHIIDTYKESLNNS